MSPVRDLSLTVAALCFGSCTDAAPPYGSPIDDASSDHHTGPRIQMLGWSPTDKYGHRTATLRLVNDGSRPVYYSGLRPLDAVLPSFEVESLQDGGWTTVAVPWRADESNQGGLVGIGRDVLLPGEFVVFHFTENGQTIFSDGHATKVAITGAMRFVVEVRFDAPDGPTGKAYSDVLLESCQSPVEPPLLASPPSSSIATSAATSAEPIDSRQAEDLRVILRHRARTGDVIRIVGKRLAHDDTELESLLRSEKEARRSESGEDPVVTIDATMDVPWNAIVTVLNACQHLGIERVEFDFGSGAK